MVDEATKKSLAKIPLLKTKAGPRDGELWIPRLKEEYQSLIQVSRMRHPGLCQTVTDRQALCFEIEMKMRFRFLLLLILLL